MPLLSRKSITFMMVALLAMLSIGSVSAVEPANDDFQRTWARTDKPVSDLVVSRTWMWGPDANSESMLETYAESPNGQREVQYYDKSRMEINHPDAERDLWYVTNGLLVVELITGQMQVGDNTFEPRFPAEIPVAGDADDTSGPTYAALAEVLDDDALDVGAEITWRIDSAGAMSNESPLTGHSVTAAYLDEETNHAVASPFWEFMNSDGIVWQDEAFVTDALFENPFYATGRPITEAYWAEVKVDGQVQPVLLQCFERRCLTYTPQNEPGWQVEAGNVGLHYFNWRYEQGQPGAGEAWLYLVSRDDGGPVGCDDTMVPVTVEVNPDDPDRDVIAQALDQLFAIDDEFYGESGLYNALHASDLQVESTSFADGVATIHITGDVSVGGACDEPRFIEQIRQTVLALGGHTAADIFINDIPLDEVFGPSETQTAMVYFVETDENGDPVGCGDPPLVGTEISFSTEADPIVGALTALFAFDERNVGEDQLYNALYQSDLTVADVSVENGNATVALEGTYQLGGTCDNPRFIDQITQTVLQFDDVTTADITLNGTPINDLLSPQG